MLWVDPALDAVQRPATAKKQVYLATAIWSTDFSSPPVSRAVGPVVLDNKGEERYKGEKEGQGGQSSTLVSFEAKAD